LAGPRARMVLFALMAALACRLGFWTFSPRVAVNLVQNYGYAVMLGTFGLFAWSVVRLISWNKLAGSWRGGGWKIVLLVVAASAVLHIQEPHGFKVVNDEILQVSTSQRMHFSREANTVQRAYQLGNNFELMQGDLDKRPLFFPFLISVLHDVSGYRPENAFILNALLTPVLLGLLYLVVRMVIGPAGGVSAILLFITAPLLTQTVAGGGFEVLNLVMILATLYLGMHYAAAPSAATVGAFALAGVLLAQVRYESVLFVAPVAAVILYVSWKNRVIELPWQLLCAPLLLVLYPLQFSGMLARPDPWQLGDRPSGHGLYSLAYFYDNVGKALRYFLSGDHSQSNSHLVVLGGIIGIGFFWMYLYRRNREMAQSRPTETVFAIFIVALCAQAFLMLCYFWGAYDEVLTVRLSLPTQLLFVLAFVFIYPHLVPATAWRWRLLLIGTGLYFCWWTLPTLAARAYAHENLAAETCNWYRDYLNTRPDRHFLVIEPAMPRLWIAYGVPSIGHEILAQRVDEFCYHYRMGTFGDCLVVQKLGVGDYQTGGLVPVALHDFGRAMKLETVREIRYKPTYAIRISRMVELDEKGLRAWAATTRSMLKNGSSVSESAPDPRDDAFTKEWLRKLP
jgi:Dolichyl-phosphate-mannose-protein mannosyltransferase